MVDYCHDQLQSVSHTCPLLYIVSSAYSVMFGHDCLNRLVIMLLLFETGNCCNATFIVALVFLSE